MNLLHSEGHWQSQRPTPSTSPLVLVIMQDLADLRAMALNAYFTVADMAHLGGWET
jgi:hypothetical protein